MRWLAGYHNLQLDIVGFLAILGEGSVKANAQVSTLSLFSLLPRLLPAPQALIPSSRPSTLKSDRGKVIGARSGGIRDYVNHIAHLLHNSSPLPAYAVRCESVRKASPKSTVRTAQWGPLTWLALLCKAFPESTVRARQWGPLTWLALLCKASQENTVRARQWGPPTWLALMGTVMSGTLLGLSIWREDGFALLGTVLLSVLSSLIGLGSWWKLELKQRQQARDLPDDHIVIKYPHGAFLVVECDENLARELYWHPEECKYLFEETTYRIISLVGTITLMFGVICLANSTLELQIAFAAAYMILNAAYWVVAALPPQWHWDLSRYEVQREDYGDEKNENFTLALWKAIAVTRSVEWVKAGQVAPVNEGWDNWVKRAGEVVRREEERDEDEAEVGAGKGKAWVMPDWNAELALTEFLNPNRAGLNV